MVERRPVVVATDGTLEELPIGETFPPRTPLVVTAVGGMEELPGSDTIPPRIAIVVGDNGVVEELQAGDTLPGSGLPFFDDFNRPDSTVLGNGWIEKIPAVFEISNNTAIETTVPTNWLDNMAYRPPLEEVIDSEIIMGWSVSAVPVGLESDFAVLSRIQSATAATPGEWESYFFYLSANSGMVLGRSNASSQSFLFFEAFQGVIDTVSNYRYRLVTTGASPVHIEAYVESFNGSTWDIEHSITHDDSDAAALTSAGVSGFHSDGASRPFFINDFSVNEI